MVKLTEDMVIARSKGAELHNIKKLNCWGSELTDVSVVKKLTNVEVLSLSVNKINTLEDFEHCRNLQELYIRKNNIKYINDVLYLRELPKLKSLWLNDNPCAEFDQYRLTVLRALPHLQKLDNIAVEPEEVQKAMVYGLPLPKEPISQWEDRLSGPRQAPAQPAENGGSPQYYSEVYSSNQVVSPKENTAPMYNNHVQEEYEQQTTQPIYNEDDEHIEIRRRMSQPRESRSQEPIECDTSSVQSVNPQTYRHSYAGYEDGRRNQMVAQQQTNLRRQSYGSQYSETKAQPRQASMRANMESDQDTEYEYRPYTRGVPQEYTSRAPFARDDSFPNRRLSRDAHPEQAWTDDSQHIYDMSIKRHDHLETASIRSPESPACPRTFHARPKSRNANLLSAVLCLIKELDFNGLEVAEMAIQRRMDELD